ncbi:MAG: hypothetical protein WAR79_16510 [Melioribacteraceae bacterium]
MISTKLNIKAGISLIKNGDGLKINQCFPNIPYSIGVKNSDKMIGIKEKIVTANVFLNLVLEYFFNPKFRKNEKIIRNNI